MRFPIRHLTAIELEPAVIEGSLRFARWNFSPWKDKRLRLLTNDGRNFLAATTSSFDVIISEPSNPWISGQANLFTKEYFQLTRKRLRPGGIFCQWVQFYELSFKNILLILQTLHSVYPYVYMFEPEFADSDKIILASMKPLQLSAARLDKLIKQKRVKRLMASIQMRGQRDLFARYLIGGKALKGYLHKQPLRINSDGHNKLEFSAPFDLVRPTTTSEASKLGNTLRKLGKRTRGFLVGNKEGEHDIPTKGAEWLDKAISTLTFGDLATATQELKIALKLTPAFKPLAKRFHWFMSLSKIRKAPEIPNFKPKDATEKRLWSTFKKARAAYRKGRYKECQRMLAPWNQQKAHPALLKRLDQAWLYMAYCAFEQKEYTNALGLYGRYRHPEKSAKGTKHVAKRAAAKGVTPTSQPAKRGAAALSAASKPASRPASKPASRPTKNQ